MRVLLDTNILISYLLTPAQNSPITSIVTQALRGDFVLLLPEELPRELKRKAHEKKYLAERIVPEEVEKLIDILTRVSEAIPKIGDPIPAVTRDPKDDYLLAYALVGRADYLVTGDDDLLSLGKVGALSIVNPQEFLKILLIASTVGEARLRTFSRAQIEEWLQEDQIDRETRSIADTIRDESDPASR